jgi:hypothetical protein
MQDKIYTQGEGLDAQRLCSQCDFSERLGDVSEPDESVVKIQLPD